MTAAFSRCVPALALLAALLLPAGAATAQSLSFGGGGKGDVPVEIYSQDGIEWQQDKLLFVARGDARAVRGDVTVYGDELRAYYREKNVGGSEIWRLDAVGNVRIASADETAYGDHAVYDVDNQILTVRGDKVRLVAGEDTLTAERQLEYWEARQMAVARGNAVAIRADKRLRADVLAAYFRKNDAGENKVYRVDAFDNVVVKTKDETATGDRGVYNVESGVATLTGNVELLRDGSTLNGCRAEVNLDSGVSNLYPCPGPGGRVKGVLKPKNVESESESR